MNHETPHHVGRTWDFPLQKFCGELVSDMSKVKRAKVQSSLFCMEGPVVLADEKLFTLQAIYTPTARNAMKEANPNSKETNPEDQIGIKLKM